MIRHIFKLVWNRKKTHVLIMAEIFFAFAVVFALLAGAIHFNSLYRQPLGFEYANVLVVEVDRETRRDGWEPEEARKFRRLRHELEAMPEILHVATANNHPFSASTSIWTWRQEGRDIQTEMMSASTTFLETMQMNLLAGRWFEPADDSLDWDPAVIDVRLSRLMYGDGNPIGRVIHDDDDEKSDRPEIRIVGLIDAFRRGGDFGELNPMLIQPTHEERDDADATSYFVLKLASNTPAAFEQTMIEKLQAGASDWTFAVKSLEVERKASLQTVMIPLAIFGTVGAFLLIMVVLGLTGVMWQNVTRRTREIGLRRAAGASRSLVHRQIVMEVMVIAVFAVALGAGIALQIPYVGPFSFLPMATAVQAAAGSSVAILLLAGLCGLYPGWSATRILPAEALHYE